MTGQKILRWMTACVIAAAGVAAITAISIQTHANATTASLAYMVLVLLTSLLSGLGPGIFAAVSSTLCLNYYFLPPIGTFVIDRTEDWIALTAFLLSAVLVSELSSAVKKRAVEAERARDELAGLYKLSHALMSAPASSLESTALAKIILEAFGLEYCNYHASSGEKLDTLVDEHAKGVRYVSVRAGEKLMGVLTLKPDRLANSTLNAIAGLLALALDQPS